MINPDVIKSISILKGAAATAIYGIKGADGVILVTTKRGKVGKPIFHLKSQWGLQTPVRWYHTLDAYHTALLRNEALENAGMSPVFTQKDLKLFKSGADPYGHPDVNWNHVLFKPTALMQRYNLDVSGGTEKVRYFIAAGYLRQGGLLRDIPYKGPHPGLAKASQINNGYYYKRYKFRSNLDIQAKNSLHFKLDITGTHDITNQPEVTGPLSTIYRFGDLNPYIYPIYNPNGTYGYANPQRIVPTGRENNIVGLVALGGYRRDLNDFLDIHLSGRQKLDAFTPGLALKASVAFSFANTASRNLFRGQEFPSFYYNPRIVHIPRGTQMFSV